MSSNHHESAGSFLSSYGLTQADLYRIISAKVPQCPRYAWILATPVLIQVGHLLVKRPLWYAGCDNDWERDVAQIRARENRQWLAREKALAKHYGVKLGKELLDLDNPWRHLLLRVAQAHVPGFRFQLADSKPRTARRGATPAMAPEQIFTFAVLVALSIRKGRRDPADIVRDVLEEKGRRQILMPPRSKSKTSSARRPIDRGTAGRLLKQMQNAWCAVRDGHAVAFQYGVVYLALAMGDWPDCNEIWSTVLWPAGERSPGIIEKGIQ